MEQNIGDLVIRKADIGGKNRENGKLTPTWEGPYRVTTNLNTKGNKLETLKGKEIPRTWNATNLRAYFS